jgi:hypothetical protein
VIVQVHFNVKFQLLNSKGRRDALTESRLALTRPNHIPSDDDGRSLGIVWNVSHDLGSILFSGFLESLYALEHQVALNGVPGFGGRIKLYDLARDMREFGGLFECGSRTLVVTYYECNPFGVQVLETRGM